MTSIKYLLLGGIAATTAIAFTAVANNHPHPPKASKQVKSDIPVPKLKKAKPEKMATKMESKSESKSDKDDKEEKWDVMDPPGDKREIDINVDQGTWMSLDVSPDGKTLAFDLLGDIYTMPITGGKATNIASGLALSLIHI